MDISIYNILHKMDIEAIVKDCQNGNRDAFGTLYQIFSLPMMGVIGYYVHNKDIAQDILHDGFIVAFTSIVTLKDATKIESWLTTIMKNLSLQYLRKESEHVSIHISDTDIPERLSEQNYETDLSWSQLESIIQRLPDGYRTVFRLNVLQGLSHKEIAELLGISHLTSASQLHHAKVMLRKMISQYRAEMGVTSILILTTLVIYNSLFRRNIQEDAISSAGNTLLGHTSVTESIKSDSNAIMNDNRIVASTVSSLHNHTHNKLVEEKDTIELKVDTNVVGFDNSTPSDSTAKTIVIPDNDRLIAKTRKSQLIQPADNDGWTFSLAYSGTTGQNNRSKYKVPDISSDVTDQDIEENRKIKHYVPVSVGISVGRRLSPKWSIESGLRYTYLRTDIFTENKYHHSESTNKIHYLGAPLKFNYNIFQANRLSIYGQSGIVLDIPVNGKSSTSHYNYNADSPIFDTSRLSVPMQWSVEGGIGIECQFTPSISIYAEPSINYYFRTEPEINTIRQDKPFEFTLPIGIRMTW